MERAFYQKVFAIAAVVLLGWALLRMLDPFWGALGWAVFLAFLLAPLQAALTRGLGGRPGAAAGILVALTPVLLLGPVASLGVVFANQAATLIERLQQSPLRFDAGLLERVEAFPRVAQALAWIRQNVNVTAEQIQEAVVNAGQAVLKGAASAGGNVVLGTIGTIVGFFLMLFLLFFLLRDGREMLDRLVRLVPMAPMRRIELLQLVASTTRGVVYGTVLTALLQGALVAIAFAICGLASPVVFGVLAGLFALLPVGGTAIVWAPAALWLASQGSWGLAIFMLVWGVAVSAADNVMRPLLISRTAPVSTLAVFVGVIGGVAAFGTIGLVVGPVLLTLIVALLRFVDERGA